MKRERVGSPNQNRQRALRHALLVFTVLAPLFTFWQLKTHVQLACTLLAGTAAAASAFPRLAIVQASLVALAIFGAFFNTSVGLSVTLFPSRTDDGHLLMPIGQVLLGGIVGIVLGAAVTLGYFRALRQRQLEARYLCALAALLALVLVIDLAI